MHVGTIISHHYLAHARTLAESLRRHNPTVGFTVAVVGDGPPIRDEPFDVLTEHDLGLPDLARRRRAYDDFEYAVSFKPTLLSRLLERDELAVFLDADLYVLASFDGLEEVLAGVDVGLTPHLLAQLPEDGLQPSAVGILRSGVFNTGFVAVRRTSGADAFLRWWAERLASGCRDAPGEGYFVDQRWLDLAPAMFPGVHVIRDTAWNLGHWNLPGEELVRDHDGWRIGGRLLRAFHFSGFDPDAPQRLSKHQNRIVMQPGTPLAALATEYAAAIKANGYRDVAGGDRNTYYGRTLGQRIRLPLSRRRALLAAKLRRRR